jgi:Flp pilus assembly protein TadD
MRNRTINAFLIAFTLVFVITAFWSATTTNPDGDDAANVVAADGSRVGASEDTATADAGKKKGNRFARFFKAPLKAVGRLFGGGDDNRMQRMTEKDVAKFESAPSMRVNDARSPAPNIASEEGASARDLFERGRSLLADGQLNDAIAELSRAVALDPKLSQARSLLAVAYDRKGLKDRARETFERAADDTRDPQTLNNIGYWLYSNGNYRAAVDKLKRAAKYAPDDERILNNLALAQARLGKYDDAYKNFAHARGDYEGHLNTAALAERMGRDAEAIEHYESAKKLQPNSEVALRRLADLYQRNGRADSAARARQELEGAQALASKE